MAPPNSVVCEVCVQETREERRERDGRDRESKCGKMVNLAKGIAEFLLYIPVEREKYIGSFPIFCKVKFNIVV